MVVKMFTLFINALCITPDRDIITNIGNNFTAFSSINYQVWSKRSQRGQFNTTYGIAVNSVGIIFATEELSIVFCTHALHILVIPTHNDAYHICSCAILTSATII